MDYFLTFAANTDNYSSKISLNKYTEGEECEEKNILSSTNILELFYHLKIIIIKEKAERSNYIKKIIGIVCLFR